MSGNNILNQFTSLNLCKAKVHTGQLNMKNSPYSFMGMWTVFNAVLLKALTKYKMWSCKLIQSANIPHSNDTRSRYVPYHLFHKTGLKEIPHRSLSMTTTFLLNE